MKRKQRAESVDVVDSRVISAVLAAASDKKYKMRRGTFTLTLDNERDHATFDAPPEAQFVCCAVGAGLLYAGVPRSEFTCLSACAAFAKTYGVSKLYAIGVSDGFEGGTGITDGYELAEGHVPEGDPYVARAWYLEHDDYRRGFDVGLAIAEETGFLPVKMLPERSE